MTAPIRHRALGLLGSAAVVLTAAVMLTTAGRAQAAAVGDARIAATFVMHGRIIAAVRVSGERRGQPVTRRWTFAGVGCTGSVCPLLTLRRQRSAHRFDRVTLARVGIGSYAGSGRFTSALRCRGRRFPHGLVVPYTVHVQVTQVVGIEGIPFADRLSAVYTNRRRIDHTRCPIGPSHDAARYSGTATPLPSPPAASFQVATQPTDDSASVTDTSTPGAGGAPIVARLWQFGDPASGATNTATTSPAAHTFSAPGAYQVSLTVTDANGLTATSSQTVIAPGPPTAAFSDAGSATNLSGAQSPSHTFSAPGTYQVCLIVTDANGRHAGHCTTVLVPAGATAGGGAQASKRTVASAAPSSPIS